LAIAGAGRHVAPSRPKWTPHGEFLTGDAELIDARAEPCFCCDRSDVFSFWTGERFVLATVATVAAASSRRTGYSGSDECEHSGDSN
jgi:hypothetical protein